jgi:hypothetical protein
MATIDDEIERVLSMSDEELCAVIRAEGRDPGKVADEVRATLDRTMWELLARDRKVVVMAHLHGLVSEAVYRRFAFEVHPAEVDLFEWRTFDSGSVNGGTVRTIVCLACNGCRDNGPDGTVVQHHEALCPTPAKVRVLDAERVRKLRRAVLG